MTISKGKTKKKTNRRVPFHFLLCTRVGSRPLFERLWRFLLHYVFSISGRAEGGGGLGLGDHLGVYRVASIRSWDELSMRGRSVCVSMRWLQSHRMGV